MVNFFFCRVTRTLLPSTRPRLRAQDDLLHLLRKLGMPSSENVYVFNGDLVDRGDHSCEIVLLIFALKLSHPDAVFVNRDLPVMIHVNWRFCFCVLISLFMLMSICIFCN